MRKIPPAALFVLALAGCGGSAASTTPAAPSAVAPSRATYTLLPQIETISQYAMNQDGAIIIIVAPGNKAGNMPEYPAPNLPLAEGGSYTVLPLGENPGAAIVVMVCTAAFRAGWAWQVGYLSQVNGGGSAAPAEASNLCAWLPSHGASVSMDTP